MALSVVGTASSSASRGIHAFDLFDSSGNLHLVASCSGPDYVAARWTVANPAAPSYLSNSIFSSDNFRGVLAHNGYAYVLRATTKVLSVFDVTSASGIGHVGDVSLGSSANPWDIVLIPGTSYALSTDLSASKVTVWNLSTPSAPTVAGSLTDTTNLAGARGVAVTSNGSHAMVVAPGGNRLTILSLASPTAPTVVGSVVHATHLANGAVGVCTDDNYAYVMNSPTTGGGSYLTVVDCRTRTAPTVVTSLTGFDNQSSTSPAQPAVSGKNLLAPGGGGHFVRHYDVSNPASPTLVSTLTDSTNLVGVDFVMIDGSYAYAIGGSSRITVLGDFARVPPKRYPKLRGGQRNDDPTRGGQRW